MWEQTGKLLEPMFRVARMIKRHLDGIYARRTLGLMTAFMEGSTACPELLSDRLVGTRRKNT
jgi:hypothetical protein